MLKLSGENYRSTRLCVDSYERGVMKGRCYNAGLEGGCKEFEGLVQFLTSTEALFDAVHFPQSFTAKRSFTPPLDRRQECAEHLLSASCFANTQAGRGA